MRRIFRLKLREKRGNGQFSTKSAYNVMRGVLSEGTEDIAFEELWRLKVPNKILIFTWRLLRDRLPTRRNLHRQQVEINDRRCLFCSSMEEDTGHLFFHCSKISPVWWESLSWVNNMGPFPQNPKQHFLEHIFGVAQKKLYAEGRKHAKSTLKAS